MMGRIFMHQRIYIGKDACEKCDGRGSRVFSSSDWHPCSRCEGKGYILVLEVGGSPDYAMQMVCPVCVGERGTGSSFYGYGQCKDCGGTGRKLAVQRPQGD